jgi:class 3 adenylate cyclase
MSIAYAQTEKTKEVISKKTDFRIEKATAFIQVLDADLKIPVNANITITDQAGAQIASFVNQPFAKVYLPINNTYQVQVGSDKFKTQTATLNLTKVKEYELSENIYLQPNKKTIKIAVGDDDTDRSNVQMIARSKSGIEQVRFTPIEGSNEYQADIREGETYQLDLKDYSKNYIYTQDITTANAGSIIQINPEQVGNLSKTQKYTSKIQTPKEENNSIFDPTKLTASIDDNDTPEVVTVPDSTKVNTDKEAEPKDEEKAEPQTYEELLEATQADFAAREKELLDNQTAVKKHLDRLAELAERKDITPAQKEKFKEVAKNYEKLIEEYDRQYQELRKQNLEKIAEIKDKMGIPRDFFKEYWYIIVWMAVAILILFISLIISGIIARNRTKQRNDLTKLNQAINKQKEIIEEERHKSESLLLNILPQIVAEELKTTGKAQMRSYERVSILFTDFKGFTEVAAKMSPERLMSELNDCFTGFDQIIGNHNMEKIKTIGDAYMCAGGLPIANKTNAIDAVKAGLAIQQFMVAMKNERLSSGKPIWELRIGIHTGPVVAGVIGKHKFAYDIWGDTVNLAARMESTGEVGKVNISESTHALVKDFFQCHYRGKVEAKNKGLVDMYFVEKALQ